MNKKKIFSLLQNIKNFFYVEKPNRDMIAYVGKDLGGNKYFEYFDEFDKNSLPSRQFQPAEPGKIDNKFLAVEWIAWLQFKRMNPPSIDELLYNQHMADIKKLSEANVAMSKEISKQKQTGQKFPAYSEYTTSPYQHYSDFDFYAEEKEDRKIPHTYANSSPDSSQNIEKLEDSKK